MCARVYVLAGVCVCARERVYVCSRVYVCAGVCVCVCMCVVDMGGVDEVRAPAGASPYRLFRPAVPVVEPATGPEH